MVTSLRLKLHPLPDISDGIIVFPWEQARDVSKAYNSLTATAPDELTLMPSFFPGPDGKLIIILHHSWCGASTEDERVIEQVKAVGVPVAVQVSRKNLAQILKEAEQMTMEGIYWIVRTVTLAELVPGAIEVIVEAMENRSSPLSWVSSHPFYGAGERIAPEATAFGIRARHFMVGIYTAWEPSDEAPHRVWADDLEAALKPFALPSFYPNYFGTDRPEQASLAYGQNKDRLLRLKERYDPENMFAAISLPSK